MPKLTSFKNLQMLVNKAHNSRMIMKIEHEVINLCIMGGGLVQSIRTTLPLFPCLQLNQHIISNISEYAR